MRIDRNKVQAQRSRALAALSVPDLPQQIRDLYKGVADKAEVSLELDAAQQRLAQERTPPAAPTPASDPAANT